MLRLTKDIFFVVLAGCAIWMMLIAAFAFDAKAQNPYDPFLYPQGGNTVPSVWGYYAPSPFAVNPQSQATTNYLGTLTEQAAIQNAIAKDRWLNEGLQYPKTQQPAHQQWNGQSWVYPQQNGGR